MVRVFRGAETWSRSRPGAFDENVWYDECFEVSSRSTRADPGISDMSRPYFVVAAVFLVSGCAVHISRATPPGPQYTASVANPEELPPAVADALRRGHILLGMSTRQVLVALGPPVRRTRFDRTGADIWVYKAFQIYQQHHLFAGQDVRLVFIADRLVSIDPL